ncbi:MAG: lipase maturation factor family protein [Cephaloticoccus sp.]|nr:lipase maturation factor family protein [Cephaloticoccus sp.]MCF7759229.1 lipase maturation factor family protein [Cephaloticoccus sp.]
MSRESWAALPLLPTLWHRLKEFAGFDRDTTYLWPRWLVLRAVGLVYIVIFAGIIDEAGALIGPNGLAPLPELMAQLRASHPTLLEAVFQFPTLFWISTHPLMPPVIAWTGLVAAVALVLNLWPRLTLFVCWLALLSFARGWLIFSDPLVDWLMLEVALLCIPFAPAGYRPGLGAQSSPRPLVVFMVRWLLFRIMFETGLSKILSGDLHWLNLTAMDVLYETAPCPTILGYLDHQLPHAWHVVEIALTFAAEIVAPLLAVFWGRRGRWLAFACWSLFQIGIQLTCNFGWLNTASFALGFLLLDDQMLAAATRRFRLVRPERALAALRTSSSSLPFRKPWRRQVLHVVLWTHFVLSILVFWSVTSLPLNARVEQLTRPAKLLFTRLGSVNSYLLYSRLDPFHFVAEFVGSNDGGVTWRPYEFRYFPQQLDRMPPFIAPRFPRFEATLQIQASIEDKPTTLYASVATRLLEQNAQVLRLFRRNPFPDAPPQMIRTPGYRYTFTDYATYQTSGLFWNRTYLGEYLPMMYLNPQGEVAQAASSFEQLSVTAHYGNASAQTYLGFLYISGEEGVTRDGAEAAKWFRRAAELGQASAQFNLALILAQGDGVPKDVAQAMQWCRRAAEQGLADAQDQLGIMYLSGEGVPRNETEALVWFEVAARSGHAAALSHRTIAISHMSPAVVRLAQTRAEDILAEISARKQDGNR